MKRKFKGQLVCQHIIFLIFSTRLVSNPTNSAVEKIEAQDNHISIIFNVDIDTTTNIYSAISIFPGLFGFWRWCNNRELVFISDSLIPDTTAYILTISPELKDISGNSVGNGNVVFTVLKSIYYTVKKIPLQWETVTQWDVETDWTHGPKVYTIKPKLHASYQPVTGIVFCWEHIYHGPLKKDYAIHNYPYFVSSTRQNYKAAVDSNGALYLIDKLYGLRYRWFIFSKNQLYRALDVSDKGEVLIALSSNVADTTTTIYLIDPTGEIIWTKKFFMDNDNNRIFALRFINDLDKFLIYNDGKVYCFKLARRY